MIIFRRLWRNLVSRGLGPRGGAVPVIPTTPGCLEASDRPTTLMLASDSPASILDALDFPATVIEATDFPATLFLARDKPRTILEARDIGC